MFGINIFFNVGSDDLDEKQNSPRIGFTYVMSTIGLPFTWLGKQVRW